MKMFCGHIIMCNSNIYYVGGFVTFQLIDQLVNQGYRKWAEEVPDK